MSDYRIGVFRFKGLMLYFARLPFGGEIFDADTEGLGRILAAINRQFIEQYNEMHTLQMQDFLQDCAEKLSSFAETLAEGNKVIFRLNQREFQDAEVITIFGELVDFYDDEVDLDDTLSQTDGALSRASKL